MENAQYWIDQLGLIAHPEGGFFKEVYRSSEHIPPAGLPSRYAGTRAVATGIYFLLTSDSFSAFHRVNSDEGWHYYTGTACILLHIISPTGRYETQRVGPDVARGAVFQYVVPANHWFAAEVEGESAFALVGCTVAPGFDFDDFQLADGAILADSFPAHRPLIERLTR